MNCQHHWIIATPDGAYSNGVCKRCMATRVFRNADPDVNWTGHSNNRLYIVDRNEFDGWVERRSMTR